MSDVTMIERWGVKLPQEMHEVDDAIQYLAVEKGSRVEVFKGRKVPVGTTGEVFWVGAGTYGTRVGLKGDDGDTYWLASDNCRPEGWAQLVVRAGDHGWDIVARQLEAAQIHKGDRVRFVNAEGQAFIGEVFWKERNRLGVRVGAGEGHNGSDVLWLNTSQVEKLDGNDPHAPWPEDYEDHEDIGAGLPF